MQEYAKCEICMMAKSAAERKVELEVKEGFGQRK